MDSDRSAVWRRALTAAVLVWVAFAVRLMIADVWDETNGMLAFSSDAMSLGAKLSFVLTQSMGFWRPLPSLPVVTILHFVSDFDVSWRLLRAVNIALLLGTLALFVDAIRAAASRERDAKLELAFTVAFLFSGSAVITAGWYANVFDAAALFLLAAAMRFLMLRHPLAAGLAIAVAFFCKESAALALPFLVVLLAAGKITFAESLKAGVPATLGGIVYFAIRSNIVPFGREGDIHGFQPSHILPTAWNLAQSFWLQTLKGTVPAVAGLLLLAISIAALRRARLIAATLLFLAACVVVYLGMLLDVQDGVLMHHLNFVGRLYLIPAALMLFILAIEGRAVVIAVLCFATVVGGVTTWRDHARFQRTYRRLYKTAAVAQVHPLRVHHPWKPLDDTVRGLKVGDIPDAPVAVDARTGRLIFR